MLLSVDPEFTVFKGSFFASMQTIIWTNEHLASGFHPSQQFVVFIFYLLFSCHIKTTTEGSEEKKKNHKKNIVEAAGPAGFPVATNPKPCQNFRGAWKGLSHTSAFLISKF